MDAKISPAELRVRTGVAFFRKYRAKWRERVTVSRTDDRTFCSFTMGSTTECLLCRVEQVPTFKEALVSAGLSAKDAIALGFLRAPDDPVTMYGQLQVHWQNAWRLL